MIYIYIAYIIYTFIYISIYIDILDNGKSTFKFQVLRVSYQLPYKSSA